MNKYQLRTTLTSSLGSLVITDPQGVQEVPLTLTRNPVFKSVVENFETPLTYVLRAVDFINEVKALGIDTLLTQLIEVSSDFGATWETFNEGILDLPTISTLSDPTEYKIKLGCKKDDVWTKLLSRKDVDVDVQSLIDVDGNAAAVSIIPSILLTPQVIRRVCRMEMWSTTDDDFVDMVYTFDAPVGAGTDYIGAPVDLPKKVFDEVKTKYNYGGYPFIITDPVVPFTDYYLFPLVDAEETATKYEIEFRISLAANAAYNNKIPANDNIIFPTPGGIKVYYIRVDEGSPDASSGTVIEGLNAGTNGIDGRTVYTDTITELDIRKGTKIYLLFHYIRISGFPFEAFVVPNDIYGDTSFINIVAHTTFPASSVPAKQVGDIFDAIIRRITGGDNYYSDFFTTGCGAPFVNLLGLHMRGYDFGSKPYLANLTEHFMAANAIWNIGLGYEDVGGDLKVRIEDAAYFFNASSNSIDLNNVTNYTTTYKTEAINNGGDIGYSKWQLTSGGSLIDDIQTQHTYTNPFKYVGKKFSIMCSWIGAALLFELTRRAIDKPNETFDTDNDKFVLHINGSNEAKLDYVSASNLNDPDGRYNKEITPGRNFLRHASLLFVGATQYIGNVFRFVSGLGNYSAVIEITPDVCVGSDVAEVDEHANIEITGDVLNGIEVIKFDGYPLSWEQYKLIRDNKNKSIGVSRTTADHVPYFIEQIDFFLFERKANFTLFKAT
jgi:hypothetical protein